MSSLTRAGGGRTGGPQSPDGGRTGIPPEDTPERIPSRIFARAGDTYHAQLQLGENNTHEPFLGGVGEHFQPPSSSNNTKNTTKKRTWFTHRRAEDRLAQAAAFG